MKEVILSADGDCCIYCVPDVVAENLKKYCVNFCDKWLWSSPYAKKYHTKEGVCYTEEDFIEYLNKYIFPNEQSYLVKVLGNCCFGPSELKECNRYPYFNF